MRGDTVRLGKPKLIQQTKLVEYDSLEDKEHYLPIMAASGWKVEYIRDIELPVGCWKVPPALKPMCMQTKKVIRVMYFK